MRRPNGSASYPRAVDDEEQAYGGTFTFEFFEVVAVLDGGPSSVAGLTGTVLGRARDDQGLEHYAVAFDDHDGWSIDGRWLRSTGARRPRSDFYDNSRIRVSPDGEFLGFAEGG